MKTIVFIGTLKSGSSREAIKATQELGYFTVLLTDNKKQLEQREEYTDVHLMLYCDLHDIRALKITIQELKLKAFDIKAIVSFVDSHVHTACILGDIFRVNCFTTHGVYNIENKLLSRECLRYTEFVPQYKIISPHLEFSKREIINFLPAILKSPRSTGSKDVYKIEDYEEFVEHVKNAQVQHPKESLLMEEYLEGKQYLVEVFVIRGVIQIVAIIEQDIEYINKHFIVMGYSVLLDYSEEFYKKLKSSVEKIIFLHGLRNGYCHLELRLVNNKWKLIEINPRISGGGMNQLIQAAYGINLVQEIIKHSLNQKPDIEPKYYKNAYIQYVTLNREGILEKVTGKKRALKKKGVLKVYVKPRKGNQVYLPTSLGHRYAYVLAVGENKEEARINAREAIKEIKFVLKNKK